MIGICGNTHSPDTTWISTGLPHAKTTIPKEAMLDEPSVYKKIQKYKISDTGNWYGDEVVFILNLYIYTVYTLKTGLCEWIVCFHLTR